MNKLLSAALLLCLCASGPLPTVQADTPTKSHVLWKNPNGSISLWNVAADGSWLSQKDYGPFPGWTATSLSESADGLAHLIWTSTDGAMALWNLNSDGTFLSQANYGPFGGGWNAAAISGLIPPATGSGAIGSAGGDLTGTYPNPTVKANAVDHTKLAFDQYSLAQVSGGSLTCVGGNTAHGGLFVFDGYDGMSKVEFTIDQKYAWEFGASDNGNMFYFADGEDVAMILQKGTRYIGIHTETPQNTLDVNGGINANMESHFSSGTYTDPVAGTPQGLKVSGGLAADTVTAHTLQITGGSDLAEPYKIAASADVKPLPGMVVAIDPQQTGQMIVCAHAYDNSVGGIISGANGIQPGVVLRQAGTVADGTLPIASIGRVWCWCDADAGGAISPGDLLTTSDTPGHAMRVDDYGKAQGAILGKAMSSLKTGKGLVLVLVTLQ